MVPRPRPGDLGVIATALLWTTVTLVCTKVYRDIKQARPHWEMRAELATMLAGLVALLMVAAALSLVLSDEPTVSVPTPPSNIA